MTSQKAILSAILFTASASMSQAGTIDFTDGVFDVVTASSQVGNPEALSEEAAGVTFTFTALDNLVGADRMFPSATGLTFGGGGGSTIQFSLTADADVTLSGFATNQASAAFTDPTFDVMLNAVTVSSGNVGDGTSALFASGPLSLSLGDTLVFGITNPGAITQASLSSIDFDLVTTSASAVPLPASMSFLLAGLAGLGWQSRKRRNA